MSHMPPFRLNVPNLGGDLSSGVPNPKKRKKNGQANIQPQSNVQDLLPPPLSGYGDTIVASNPFDDCPSSMMSMVRNPNPMGMGMPPMGMGGMGMCRPMGGPPMQGLPPHHPHHQSMMMNGPRMNGPPQMNGPPPGMGNMVPHMMSSPNGPMHGPPMGGGNPMNNNFSMPMNSMYQKPLPVSAGKIYPADQPMVFNSQNPNAPPIYPCGICHKEVHDNDQAILCESGCNFWFHRGCTGLIETAFQLLTAEVYAEWVCDKCLSTKNIPLVKFKP